jgi:hypothetical protein
MRRLSTGQPHVRSVQCYVVFDRSDGRIHHIHEVITLEGAESQPDTEVKKRALALVAERGIDTTGLGTIAVDPEAIKPGKRYAVDTATSILVEQRSSSLRL